MRQLLSIILFLIFFPALFAQRAAKLDSILNENKGYSEIIVDLRQKISDADLQNALKNEIDEKVKVKLVNALCWKYFSSNPQQALEYAKLQLDLAKNLKMKDALEAAYDNFGFL